MKVTLDFETRSEAELKTVGGWVYSCHPSTEALCCAVKVDGDAPRIWIPPFARRFIPLGWEVTPLTDQELFDILATADEIEAHNSFFETAIWMNVCTPKYGWPPIVQEKMRCSMSRCAYFGLPSALDAAAKTIFGKGKDYSGYKVMLKMCKPRGYMQGLPVWHEEPASFGALCRYCLCDVEAEHAVSAVLPPLPPRELKIWQIDQQINLRGVHIDVKAAQGFKQGLEEFERNAGNMVPVLTNNKVKTVTQVAALIKWAASKGVILPNLSKAAVAKALADPNLPPDVKQVLKLRKMLGRSSTSKFTSMLEKAGPDGRVRDCFAYSKAITHRWAGKGVQLQNLPRPKIKDATVCADLVASGGWDMVEMLWPDAMEAAVSSIRSCITAGPGKEFVCSDYSSIEGRGLPWLAGEQWVLDAILAGKDMYKVAASGIFGIAYDDVGGESDERQVGKVSELALGYGGGISAFVSMAKNYGMDLEKLAPLILPGASPQEFIVAEKSAGYYLARLTDDDDVVLSKEAAMACDIIKQRWRLARPNIVAFWRDLEEAAIIAVKIPGTVTTARRIQFKCESFGPLSFLRMRLPSGNFLYYFKPRLSQKETHNRLKETLAYEGVNEEAGGKFMNLYTYGGKLSENATQAVCRDILVEGIFNTEAAGYPTVLHVHDEVAAEVDPGFGSVLHLEKLLSSVPAWADGFPVKAAKGWRGVRYRK